MPAKDRCDATYGRCGAAAVRCVRAAGHDGNHAAVTAAGNIRGRVSWLAAPNPEHDRTTPRAWRPANNGAGARRWFLIATDETLPVADRYHLNSRGDLIRYASHDTAARAAERLNR